MGTTKVMKRIVVGMDGSGLPPSGLSAMRYALRRQLEEDWCAPLRSSSLLPFAFLETALY
jgi:hypothetical protein